MGKKPYKDEKQQDRALLRALSFFSQIGITMASCVLVGVLSGRFLDNLFNTSPWLLLLSSLLGALAALKMLFHLGTKR